jgi:hypothetical protein
MTNRVSQYWDGLDAGNRIDSLTGRKFQRNNERVAVLRQSGRELAQRTVAYQQHAPVQRQGGQSPLKVVGHSSIKLRSRSGAQRTTRPTLTIVCIWVGLSDFHPGSSRLHSGTL